MTDDRTTSPEVSSNGAHAPHVVDKGAAYRATSEASELLRADAGDIAASSVDMDRSGAEQITAERVSMTRSGAKSLEAKSAQLDNSGVLNLTAVNAVLHKSSSVALTAKTARIVKSRVVILRSESTTVEGELRPLVHIGQACDNVKPVLDGNGALRFGAALGATLLIGSRILRLIFRAR